jgi:hypothetical protein
MKVAAYGIGPATKSPVTRGNAEIHDAKQHETTRNDLRIREGC